jgi:hypothetical protein
MGMGIPLSTPARYADLALKSYCYLLLLRHHGLKAKAAKQPAKIEWPVPPNTVARVSCHSAELIGTTGDIEERSARRSRPRKAARQTVH